ncbi:MAG: translocation/assembly module TamB domain-containing protein [Candidatus Sulfopaludibacter sp.]|nr:translocation/assembly module TamB domain-containing protein [Candidatus Sulfopaludibacter sp.]
MSRKRKVWILCSSLAGVGLFLAGALVMTLQSAWLYNKVRERIVTEVEKATGGRVELASFRFDWRRMRAEAGGLTVHGKEPADRPPLLHASSVVIGLKMVSLLRRDVNIQSVDIAEPRVFLIVNPDGSTNLPEPKTPRNFGSRPLDPLFQLAAGRFQLRHGIFEVESRSRTPFDARGQNLELALFFDGSGPRYRGTLSMRPLEVRAPGVAATPLDVTMALAVERNRIGITSANIATGHSRLQLSGELADLQSPRGAVHYQVHASVADASRIFGIKLLDRGEVQSQGTVTWPGGAAYTVTGDLHASGVDYRGAYVQLRNSRAEGAISVNPQQLELTGLRFSTSVAGSGTCKGSVWPCATPLAGHIAAAEVRGKNLELRGLAVALLGGQFQGQARLLDLDRFTVDGEISGVDARRAVAVYSPAPLPWNGLVSGQTSVEGRLQRSGELRAQVDLSLTPSPEGAPVHGQLTATYDTRGNRIDVDHSTLALPSSRAEMSGVVGSRLLVHLETHDLNDFLPVLGQSAASIPVKLQNGSAVFDGAVTGTLDRPQLSGHLQAANAVYSGQTLDAFQSDVDATQDNLRLRNASLARGSLRGQFQLAVALQQWKPQDSSLIDGSGSVRGAAIKDLAALVTAKQLPVSGTLNATAQMNGTIGDPLVTADLEVTKGETQGEPFDRFTGRLRYTARQIELTGGQATAGSKTAQLAATFDHAPQVLDAGRLHFQIGTSAAPLDQIKTLAAQYPGVKGAIQLTASGSVDLAPARNGEIEFRVVDLQGEFSGRGLQLSGQALGDVHLTVNSQGQVLHAHLESAMANSTIRGDGAWNLEGDDPGTATVTFSRVDFAALRDWLLPLHSAESLPFTGFAEGQLTVSAPLLKPQAGRAELRIPNLEITTAPLTSPKPATAPPNLTLRNSGPIVASLVNSVITVTSAHLVGRDTDLTVTGKASLQDKSPLDLRVNGKIDLAIMREVNRDFVSSGTVSADATIRGTFAAPQVSGRMAFQNATFQVSDLPNGISNANGAILFTGDRATIQSFSGETGGGRIALSGFAAYSGGPLAYRLHARLDEVRIRYPEGVSTVANASLNFTGTTDRSMLAGTITVLRTGFNPQSDFSSMIASSAEPVRTLSAQTGILGGMNFDIQIQTAPDIQVQSTLTQDIDLEANLRLRGTFSNPAVLGRINVTQGRLVFFGTKYNISQGSIAFYNPVRVEPVLDIDLETKARGVDVTLTVSGPLAKLTLTPRSDPPLQFNEIVALLATGRAPSNDPAMLAQQATSPQSWQQMGASALLGQAIASPVTGRLQRFFGVSNLRIDPTLPGIEYNQQARLTLEQQVTQDITFTYITDVTTSNPQIVQVEWAFAKQWSVVALREENGMFGIDFYFKKRF